MNVALWPCVILALGIAWRYGCSGLLIERRVALQFLPGPWALPDGLWTIPLVISLVASLMDRSDWRLAPDYAVGLGGVSLLVSPLVLGCYRVLFQWQIGLPRHIALIADYCLWGRTWRLILRALAWQGTLLLLPATRQALEHRAWLAALPASFLVVVAVWVCAHVPRVVATTSRFRDPFRSEAAAGSAVDWFLSYKSHDSDAVRWLADSLLLAGQRPWFAEYMIRMFARDQFQTAIDQGIAASRGGVLITNDRYAGSDHCGKELELLAVRARQGQCRLYEIAMPPEPLTRARHSAHLRGLEFPSLTYGDDTLACLEFLEIPTSRDWVPRCGALAEHEFAATSLGACIRLRAPQGVPEVGRAFGPAHQPQFSARWAFSSAGQPFEIDLLVTPYQDPTELLSREIAIPVARPSHFSPDVNLDQLDDRALCASYRNFELFRSAMMGQLCVGFHLFHQAGRGHPLLTLWTGMQWMRRYYLLSPAPRGGGTLLIRVDFRCAGQLRELWRHSEAFDQVVRSLELTAGALHEAPSSTARGGSSELLDELRMLQQITAHLERELAQAPPAQQVDVLYSQAFRLVEFWQQAPIPRPPMPLTQALQRLELVAAARPNWGPVYDETAYVLSRLNRHDEALLAAERAERCDPDNPKYIAKRLAMKVHLLAQQSPRIAGDSAPARETLADVERLLVEHPEYPNGMFLKAQCLAVLGRPQSQWEECLALGALAMGNRTRMATGYSATLARLIGTLRDSSILCYALADRA